MVYSHMRTSQSPIYAVPLWKKKHRQVELRADGPVFSSTTHRCPNAPTSSPTHPARRPSTCPNPGGRACAAASQGHYWDARTRRSGSNLIRWKKKRNFYSQKYLNPVFSSTERGGADPTFDSVEEKTQSLFTKMFESCFFFHS